MFRARIHLPNMNMICVYLYPVFPPHSRYKRPIYISSYIPSTSWHFDIYVGYDTFWKIAAHSMGYICDLSDISHDVSQIYLDIMHSKLWVVLFARDGITAQKVLRATNLGSRNMTFSL